MFDLFLDLLLQLPAVGNYLQFHKVSTYEKKYNAFT